MKKIIIIILAIIGLSLIAIGVLIPTNSSSNNNSNKQQQDKNPNTVENKNNEQLQKERCLENICVNNLIIAKQENIYSISADLKNIGEIEIQDSAINLIFTTTNNTTIKKTQYIQKLEPNQTVVLEIQFTTDKEELLNATSYKLEYATEQEKESIKQNIVD